MVCFDFEGTLGMPHRVAYDLAEATTRLLGVLARYDARAVFFVVGRLVHDQPDVVRAIAAAGHEIGLHGYSHEHLDRLTDDGLASFEADLTEVVDTAADAGLSAGDTAEIVTAETEHTKANGKRKGLGWFVKLQIAEGVRGKELAAKLREHKAEIAELTPEQKAKYDEKVAKLREENKALKLALVEKRKELRAKGTEIKLVAKEIHDARKAELKGRKTELEQARRERHQAKKEHQDARDEAHEAIDERKEAREDFEEAREDMKAADTPEERKEAAREYFERSKSALLAGFASAPEILFVASAGNANQDSTFAEAIPADVSLPNVVTVGAVDKAGDEAPFTSYGRTVKVHANGYQVESTLPGGDRVALSGTSMSAPQVTGLAAKLLAVRPRLTPAELIAIIQETAERTADGRRILIHPARALAAAQARPD